MDSVIKHNYNITLKKRKKSKYQKVHTVSDLDHQPVALALLSKVSKEKVFTEHVNTLFSLKDINLI